MAAASLGRQEILVVCLVESSVSLLHEWGEVLVGYLSPLLQRIAAGGGVKGVKNEFRIGFVSYSDPHIHPNPILAKRFFSPPFQLTKELKEDPASLGLGRTASSGRRGMAILEGYVAVLEMFDAIADTRPPRQQAPNEAQPDPLPDPICYLIHIACSPPNKAKKPAWNMDPTLDGVTWDSLPYHLLKRKIRTSMILIRPISELQELYNHLSRTPEPFWLPMIRPNHKTLLTGLPPVLKDKVVPQKRPASDNPEPPPPSIRPAQEQPTATAAVPSNVAKPANSRPESVVSSQPVPVPPPQPQPQPPAQPPSQTQPPQPRRPNIASHNIDPHKLLSYIRSIEAECRHKHAALSQARATGKPKAELDIMQSELNQKAFHRQKLIGVYQQFVAAKQQQNGGQDSALTTQISQPMNLGQSLGQGGHGHQMQEHPTAQTLQPNAIQSGSGQGTQSGTPANASFPNFNGPPIGNNPFQNIPIAARPGMEAQMQKILAERARAQGLGSTAPSQPPIHGNQMQAPQPNPGNPGTSNPNIAEIMTPRMKLGPNVRRWQGILAWPSVNIAGRKENQIAIAFFTQDANFRCESWPQKLILQPSRGSLMNGVNVQTWVKESNPVMGLISHTPIVGNIEATAQNIRMFRSLRELIHTKNLLAYCKFDMGGPPGTGILAFPMNVQAQNDILVTMVFNKTPLPAAVTAHVPAQPQPVDAGIPKENAVMQQPMRADGSQLNLQNLSPEVKAFLQQRQAAALAAYSQQQQQAAHQQQQAQQMIPNLQGGGSNVGSGFDVARLMQTIRTGAENHSLSNVPQQPIRQSPAFNQNLQMLQYMNRRPDEGQGQ